MVSAAIVKRMAAATLALSLSGAGAIVAFEGMRKAAYRDAVGVVTVCAGHTRTAKIGQVKTEAECAELLKQDTEFAAASVRRVVKVPITQEQFDALVSFTFNVGVPSFEKSTLLKKVNSGDCLGAGKEFSRWTYAGGRELPGLVSRRADERKRWETGCAKAKDIAYYGVPKETRSRASIPYFTTPALLAWPIERRAIRQETANLLFNVRAV